MTDSTRGAVRAALCTTVRRWAVGSAGVLLALCLAVAGAAAAHAKPDPEFRAPDGATAVWIDIENESLDPGAVTGFLRADGVPTSLTFVASPTGLTAQVIDPSPSFSLELVAETRTQARVSVTFADAAGSVRGGSSSLVTLPAKSTTVVPPDPPTDDPTAKRPESPGSSLAQTGAHAVWGVVLIAAVCAAVGLGMVMRRRKGAAL